MRSPQKTPISLKTLPAPGLLFPRLLMSTFLNFEIITAFGIEPNIYPVIKETITLPKKIFIIFIAGVGFEPTTFGL